MSKKYKEYKVVFLIEVTSDSELNAAKQINDWLSSSDIGWQFYVQEKGGKELYSVDFYKNPLIVETVTTKPIIFE